MHSKFLLCSFSLGLVTSLACSGGSSEVGANGATTSEEGYCSALSRRAQRCTADSGVPVTDKRASCGKDYRCNVALLSRPDAYFACRTKSECTGAGNEACTAQAAGGAGRPEADTCAKRYASCKSAGGKSFDNDTCPTLSAVRADALARIMPCFDKPCGDIDDCVVATVNAFAPDCD